MLFAIAWVLSAPSAQVSITVSVEHNRGAVYCSLFNRSEGFPGDEKKAMATRRVKPTKGKALCIFKSVPPGTYAAAAYHDENSNGELDTNWVGIPSEGIGASNGATGTLGPPKFEDAAFSVPASGSSQTLKLSY
ncbi:MAG: DUF2141 domain-containing protein [Myxococcota bacterium]